MRINEDIVRTIVEGVLNELDYRTAYNAYEKARKNGDPRAQKFLDYGNNAFAKKHKIPMGKDYYHELGDYAVNGGNLSLADNNPHDSGGKRVNSLDRAFNDMGNYMMGNDEYVKGKGWRTNDSRLSNGNDYYRHFGDNDLDKYSRPHNPYPEYKGEKTKVDLSNRSREPWDYRRKMADEELKKKLGKRRY